MKVWWLLIKHNSLHNLDVKHIIVWTNCLISLKCEKIWSPAKITAIPSNFKLLISSFCKHPILDHTTWLCNNKHKICAEVAWVKHFQKFSLWSNFFICYIFFNFNFINSIHFLAIFQFFNCLLFSFSFFKFSKVFVYFALLQILHPRPIFFIFFFFNFFFNF